MSKARMTKAALEVECEKFRQEVTALRAEIEALSLSEKSRKHCLRLELACAPYENRLRKMAESEKPRKGTALSAAESSALNQLYRQIAQIQGIAKGPVRQGRGAGSGLDGAAGLPANVPVSSLANIVQLQRKGEGSGS